jgi:hypothetical protein
MVGLIAVGSAGCGSSQPGWTMRSVPPGVDLLHAVVCPSSAQCYALGTHGIAGPGSIIGSSDGGDRWKLLMTTPRFQVSAIACPASGTCVVGGQSSNLTPSTSDTAEAFVTKDSGRSWSAHILPPLGEVFGAACVSVSVCLAVGFGGIARTTNGGTTWVLESAPRGFGSGSLASIACSTSSLCITGGSGIGGSSNGSLFLPPSVDSVSHDAGATWSKAAFVAGPIGEGGGASGSSLESISCSGPRHCVGLSTAGIAGGPVSSFGTAQPIVTVDAGRTWTRGSPRTGWAVSCARNFCVSVGGHFRDPTTTGDAFVSTDGGMNWTQSTTPSDQILTAVSCPTSTHCVSVGGALPTAKSAVIMTW